MRFNTILIPVDFTVNTEVAIAKGIELCEGPRPAIHLVHATGLHPTSAFEYCKHLIGLPVNKNDHTISVAKEQLGEWIEYIKSVRSDITTFDWITSSPSVELAIAKRAATIAPDLIIIGKNSQHSLLPFLNSVSPGRVAYRTGISVLTVKPGALAGTLKMVVVPVDSGFPEKKVAILNALGDRFFIHVRLLILVGRDDDPEKLQTSLLDFCRVLKNRSLDNISYDVMRTDNKGWDILKYCRKVNADLLVVHPGSETRVGWLNKQISDELPVSSKTQILTVGEGNLSIV